MWTTRAVTIHTDGSVEREVVGASKFRRHWIYDDDLNLIEKIGLADFKGWYRTSFARAGGSNRLGFRACAAAGW